MAVVNLLFVNMRRRNAASHTLLNTNKTADIILVQEPWYDKIGTARSDVDPDGVDILGGAANPKWDCIYPKVGRGTRCKVMAYHRIATSHFNITNRVDLNSNHHILTIDVHLGTSSFRVINVYHDTDNRNSLTNILTIDADPGLPTIIGGDFNTHSHAWSPPGIRPSPWAADFEEWALTQNLILTSAPGVPTRRGEGNQRDTTIDLVWTNAAAVLNDTFTDPVVDFTASVGSDHAGLQVSYQHILDSAIRPPQLTRFVIDDNMRELWSRRYLDLSPPQNPNPLTADEAEQAVLHLTQDIEEASMSTFETRKGYSPRGASWWDEECDAAAAQVRAARGSEARKEADKALRQQVGAAKRRWANDFLHNATPEHLWTAAKWRFGRRQRLLPALLTDIGLSDHPEHMTAALKRRFFKAQATRVPEHFPGDPRPVATRPHAAITEAEISDALRPTSNKSAPGPSGHNYKLVKWAFSTTPSQFKALFEACLKLGYHPRMWKTATIAVVPKPGKDDYSLPKCYRPVALLECLGKLLEKVIAKRLSYDITALHLIPTTQFGARPYSSTVDAGLCLTHDVEMAHAIGGVCGTVLFDIQGFFDNINHGRLVALIRDLGFSPEICNWTASFLRDRTVRLRFNNYVSDTIDLELGTPQGSPISPILSIIYASPLLHLAKLWNNASMLMFIDDGNIFARAPTYELLAHKLRECYAACHSWCRMAGLTIEPEKTEVLFFSRRRMAPALHGNRPERLLLPDWDQSSYYAVNASESVRYLGIHFDHKLAWDKHISVVSSRTKSTLKALQLLGNSVRGLDHGSWRLAYNAICVPTLTYGAPIWFKSQQKHIKALQSIQNAAVVVITGAFRSTPREPLHQLTAILPIQIRLRKLATKAAIRLLTLPASSPVLHRLGLEWSAEEGSGVPLPYNIPARLPDTCIRRLSKEAPLGSRAPPCFDHPPWRRCTPPTERFTITHNPCKGEERKRLFMTIKNLHHNQSGPLLVYCRGAGPNPTQAKPMWTGVAVAFRKGIEIGAQHSVIGHHASHRDAAFQALVDATTLAKNLLTTSPSSSIIIYTADHFVIPWCQTTDRHDNAKACRAVCDTIADILFTHGDTTLSIRWIPGHGSFLPLKRLTEVASAAAGEAEQEPQPAAATIAALQAGARTKSLENWEQIWLKEPRRDPAYRALHHPPSGEPPEFIVGIASAARPVFCTAIRLLTEHAFTGEYNARHRPRAPDPHGCQCGHAILQTPTHIICECRLFREARERILRPSTADLSPNIIFGTETGGKALAQFIEETQAGMRPRRRIPEDHG
jgi:hypothetical protein